MPTSDMHCVRSVVPRSPPPQIDGHCDGLCLPGYALMRSDDLPRPLANELLDGEESLGMSIYIERFSLSFSYSLKI